MEWHFLMALIVAIPLILFPAAFIWYLNVGGLYRGVKAMLAKRSARRAGGHPSVMRTNHKDEIQEEAGMPPSRTSKRPKEERDI